VVHELFDTIAARYADRHGGYTRVLKIGQRQRDAAHIAIIELVEENSRKHAVR
jgi:large subunit ribosomal protein L17